MIINYGLIISADILLIKGKGIKKGKSSLTSESGTMIKGKFNISYELEKLGKNLCSSLIY